MSGCLSALDGGRRHEAADVASVTLQEIVVDGASEPVRGAMTRSTTPRR